MNANTKLTGDTWLLAAKIEEKPIRRPDFTRALDVSFVKWTATNDLDLSEYYHACLVADHGDGPTFANFCRCQYDVECNRNEAEDEEHDAYQDHLANEGDSLNDARAVDTWDEDGE